MKKKPEILYSNKKNWKSNDSRRGEFKLALNRYIASFSSSKHIDFLNISFPYIVFDNKSIDASSINFFDCTFYGEVKFMALSFDKAINIQNCIFWDKFQMFDIVFNDNITILDNDFYAKSYYKNLLFKGELSFIDIHCHDTLIFDNLEFNAQTNINDIFLQQGCTVTRIKGLSFFDWDELLCVYDTPECIWDDRDIYIESYMKDNDIKSMNLAREIKKYFPEIHKDIDMELTKNNYMWSCYSFLEYFSNVTNSALKSKRYAEATKQLLFIQKKIKNADDDMVSLLDVAYVENLMWSFRADEKKEAWKYIPTIIQNRYNHIWR